MTGKLFPRLALLGILRNRKFYFPYLLSSIGVIAMYYIIHFLSRSPLVAAIPHGDQLGLILSLGKLVVVVFSLLFLFYTHSFLTRQRFREFGLYNILGMSKGQIAGIVFWESLFVSVVAVAAGLGVGILCSKLAELGFLNLVHAEIGYRFTVSGEAAAFTAALYGGIFLLLMIRSLIAIRKTDPLALMKSDAFGEKPPKGNLLIAILGAIVLGTAYALAVTIRNPLSALLLFFVAVILVIVGTYLLFISGSVALCRVLQKNKHYYYQKKHFISVSSMAYRMKRNGAGLASICILSTMVLVMISSTASLYFGADDAMRASYPLDMEITVSMNSPEDLSEATVGNLRKICGETFGQRAPVKEEEYRYVSISGLLRDDVIYPDLEYSGLFPDYNRLRCLYFLSLGDYNALTESDVSLGANEALVYPLRCGWEAPELTVGRMNLTVAGTPERCVVPGEASVLMMPSLIVIVPDFETLEPLKDFTYEYSGKLLADTRWHYGYDTDQTDVETVSLSDEQYRALKNFCDEKGFGLSVGCLPKEKGDFYATFGGMFFLGMVLSVVFIFAAAVIIYYKQISEGYEDRKRFEIMRRIGMTKKDIRETVNQQTRMVFFAPLVGAGIHLGFAFPFFWKILQMFNLRNFGFVLTVTVIAFILFGLFYAMIYMITARSYYEIVSSEV